ncbi:MAG: hypothetical protein ACPG80_00080 [Rickettsiales bacterium]
MALQVDKSVADGELFGGAISGAPMRQAAHFRSEMMAGQTKEGRSPVDAALREAARHAPNKGGREI